MFMFGPFNREESTTQSRTIAILQVATGEIWGKTPRYGNVPTVEAYGGALRAATRGIEFTTPVEPHPNGSPLHIKFYLGKTPGVESRHLNGTDYACIPAVVINRQP